MHETQAESRPRLRAWIDHLVGPSPYWLTRIVVLRMLGLVYAVAFLAAANQYDGLLSAEGLTPMGPYVERVLGYFGGRGQALLEMPSLFLVHHSDGFARALAWTGFALSLPVLFGYANGVLLFALWLLYGGFVHMGQTWYSFGWESQLLETGFLCIFLVPLLDGRPFPARAPPRVVIWLLWWLIFRIMLGAGLIKIRGDACWTDLTCLVYHYETQPIPHPLSWYFHNLPVWVHQGGVLFNHLVELGAPWLLFTWRPLRHGAALLMLAFQLTLIASGNLAFLNWLTIVPILACFDDGFYAAAARRLRLLPADGPAPPQPGRLPPSTPHKTAVLVYAVLVAWLSVGPVRNLFSERQMMNTSFDPLRLVNTYGAFGSVGKVRNEIVFFGTLDPDPGPQADWVEYEFKCKPGNPLRRPCLITPYHMRLDWLIWFAAMGSYERYPWTVHLVDKLLHNEPALLGLLDRNPFPDTPPTFVKADLYRYRFAGSSSEGGAWWERRLVRSYIPPARAGSPGLEEFLRARGW